MNSLEEAIKNKYLFKPYSKRFVSLFLSEKKFLSKIFSSIKNKEIHHIGSTSIKGLGGKGVIDIIIVVPKKRVSKSKSLLKKAGFVYQHTMRGKRSFYSKYYVDSKKKPRLIHLHLTYHGSGELDKALAFASYLRAHKKVRQTYAKIKKQASLLHKGEGKKYVKHKLKFIQSTMKKALKWYENKLFL
ncbi:MAG: GrpB family protein [archaeon]|jgi:GrpB-like predicted nucleotidyltransferase (UPF0157 family)